MQYKAVLLIKNSSGMIMLLPMAEATDSIYAEALNEGRGSPLDFSRPRAFRVIGPRTEVYGGSLLASVFDPSARHEA